MLKELFSFLLLSTFIISSPAFLLAQNAPVDPGNRAYTQDNPGQEAKERAMEFKCEITSSKMDMVTARYRTHFERHHDTYKNIVTRVSDVLDQLEDKGYDVDSARTALNSFDNDIDNAQTEFDAFLYQMEQAKGILCQNGNADNFQQSLNQSRTQLQEVRKNMLSLRSRYQRDVKPALLELRQQVRLTQDETTVPGDVTMQ